MLTKFQKPEESPTHQADKNQRVRDDVLTCLRQSKYRALAGITCEFHEGVLILRGTVRSFYLKQMAQTVVQTIEGVIQIDNRLEVEWN